MNGAVGALEIRKHHALELVGRRSLGPVRLEDGREDLAAVRADVEAVLEVVLVVDVLEFARGVRAASGQPMRFQSQEAPQVPQVR